MVEDLTVWRHLVEDAVSSIADEDLQRRSWFGVGPEIFSPQEAINGFYSDAAIKDFLNRSDNGLNKEQLNAGINLYKLMEEFMEEKKYRLRPEDLIDDPKWVSIRKSASIFLNLLMEGRPAFNWPAARS